MWHTTPERSRSTSSFAASAFDPTSFPSSRSDRGPSASADATFDDGDLEDEGEQDERDKRVPEAIPDLEEEAFHTTTLVVP